jgi:uncharacterized protein (TIGR00251 family)
LSAPAFASGPRGLSLRLRVQPGAGRDEVVGLIADAEGAEAVKLKVAAPAEGGRANAAALALLARALQLPKGSLSLLRGERDRRKVVTLEGDPAELEPRVAAWLARLRRG